MSALCALSVAGNAATLYWDIDGSAAGNSAVTGASLGGSGSWSTANINWWQANAAILQPWAQGNDAVFWGAPGTVIGSSLFVRNLAFKTTGYNIDSGTLTMVAGPCAFTVDSGVTATISSTLAGSSTLVKLGGGTLALSNTANQNTAATNGGGWRIEGGTVRIFADGSLGAPLPDNARNTVTAIELNQSTIQAGTSFELDINRRTKLNTNASTNRGDAMIDVNGNNVLWYGSIQGGAGSLRVTSPGGNGGMLILGTDKKAFVNPFGSALPAGAINLTITDGVVVQTSGQVTPTGGELGSETGLDGAPLAIKLDRGQIRSESGGYSFQRNLILGPGGGSLDTGAWMQTFTGTISGPGKLAKEGYGTLVLDNSSATWTGVTEIHDGTLQLGRGGSYGLLPGTLPSPSSVVISAGATLKFQRGSDKSFFDLISGAGGITVANSPTAIVRLVSNSTYTGPTTISSGVLMIGQGNPGNPGSIVSSIVNNSGTLVFNRVEDLIYSGEINGPGMVEKEAAGKLTLTGIHTYTGDTTVRAGTLLVNGAIGNSAVRVLGGTLAGNGSIDGPVTIETASRLAPGSSAIGALAINNSLVLSGVAMMELNPSLGTNDHVFGLTSVRYGGTLLLPVLGGSMTATNTFKLFTADSYTGSFTGLTPSSPGPGLLWNTSTLAIDGTLRVSSTVNTTPVPITFAASGNVLTLSWPSDHIGWRLQAQTNPASVGLGTNWVDVPNSAAQTQAIFTLDPAAGSVFYRLLYP